MTDTTIVYLNGQPLALQTGSENSFTDKIAGLSTRTVVPVWRGQFIGPNQSVCVSCETVFDYQDFQPFVQVGGQQYPICDRCAAALLAVAT